MSFVADLSTEIPQKLWEFFHENFGGGPAVNHLQPCTLCQQEMDAVKRRQKLELERFQQVTAPTAMLVPLCMRISLVIVILRSIGNIFA